MSSHVVSTRVYALVFGALLVLTALTTTVAFVDLGGWLNTFIALTIASIKAMLVLLFFMHVRWSSRLVQVVAATGLLFLLILFAFTLGDYLTRTPVPGWE